MKKAFFLLALLLTGTVYAQSGSNLSPGGSVFSQKPADLDTPLGPPPTEPVIEPTVIRQEHVLIPPADAHRKWQPAFANIDAWIAWIKRPEYRLLYKQQGKEFYAAVFLSGARSMVLASQPVNPESTDQTFNAEMSIDRANGTEGADWKHRKPLQILCILHTPNVGPDTNYAFDAGVLVPIRKGYNGPLHVVMQKWKENDKQQRTILDATIGWPAGRSS